MWATGTCTKIVQKSKIKIRLFLGFASSAKGKGIGPISVTPKLIKKVIH